MAHGCRQIWGDAAGRLEQALATPESGGRGGARRLASEACYRALCAARAGLCDALDALCVPPPPWAGGGDEPAALRAASLALAGGLVADRADPSGQHDPTGRGWLATGDADPEAVARARRLLVALERALSSP